MPVINRIAEYFEDMKTWRQHLHRHPELGFDCFETSAFVAERLAEFGVDEIHDKIATTGIVAIINGKSEGPTIGLRADMDALPIQEVRDLEYKSQRPGKMHACGHDGHTTMLLGAAKYLCETRNFSGRVALVFQPAEEGEGGGEVMCQSGIMDKFDIAQIYALHNWPGLEKGNLATKPGPIMACADRFRVTVKGKGGHGAMPQLCKDPVIALTAMVQNLQTIISRSLDPLNDAVLSVTTLSAGDAFNVIPDEAVFTGTMRSFDKSAKEKMIKRIETIVKNTAQAFEVEAEFEFIHGYPATINHSQEAEFAHSVAAKLMGEDRASLEAIPSMGGEDFSYMLEERPGAYVFLGQGDSAGLHHPEYDFDDEIAPIGASFFVSLVETAQPASA